MVSRITLGNAFDSGGRTVVGGSNTGFDTKALVEGLASAKRLPAVQLEKKLETDAKKQTAFKELTDTLTRFKDASNFLRNPPGVQNFSDNVFAYRTPTLSTNTGVDAANYVSATVEPGSSLNNYSIQVGALATNNIKTTNTFALAGLNTVVVGAVLPFNSGTLTIGTGGSPIVLSDGETLQQVVDHINAVKDINKVQATAIQVSTGNYRLQLKSTETGAAMNYATPGAGLFPGGFAITQDAVNSSVTIDNTTITGSSNSITAIDGLTLTLKQPTPVATSVTLAVDPDTELAKSAILNFVNAYNDLKLFNARQSAVDESGLPLDTAVLKSSSSLRNTVTSIVNEMAALVSGLTSPNSLADLGITFTDFQGDDTTPFTRNTMLVDEDTLDSILSSDFDSVRKIFEFDFSSSDTQVQIFSRTNALDVSALSLDINTGTSTYQATYLQNGVITSSTLTGAAIPGGGLLLSGQSGTALDGLQLIYSGTTNTTSVINITQGLGDRIYNTIDSVLDITNGSIAIEKQSITDAGTRMKAEIVRIDEIVARYRQQLLDKFSTLESALGSINSILASLEANSNARNAG